MKRESLPLPEPVVALPPFADPVGIQLSLITCTICNGWMPPRGGNYCSADCRTEGCARSVRDLYRKRQGLPIDHTQPTKRWIRKSSGLPAHIQ